MSVSLSWTFKAFCHLVPIHFSDLTFTQISTPLNQTHYCPLRAPQNSTAFLLLSNYPSQRSPLRYKPKSLFSLKHPLLNPPLWTIWSLIRNNDFWQLVFTKHPSAPHFSQPPLQLGWGYETSSGQRTMRKSHVWIGPRQLRTDAFPPHPWFHYCGDPVF